MQSKIITSYKRKYNSSNKLNTSEILDKLRSSYDKIEDGTIDFQQLKKIVTKDLKLNTTDDFNTIINSAHQDKKSFPNLVKSLGILKDNNNWRKQIAFSPALMKEATVSRFHRYSKNKGKIICLRKGANLKSTKDDDKIKESTIRLLNGSLNSNAYKAILRENKIDPNVEEVRLNS